MKKEPIYLKYIRRSVAKKKEREKSIKESIGGKLRGSIGYSILLEMGWREEFGLGVRGDGKVTIEGLIGRGAKGGKAAEEEGGQRRGEEVKNK